MVYGIVRQEGSLPMKGYFCEWIQAVLMCQLYFDLSLKQLVASGKSAVSSAAPEPLLFLLGHCATCRGSCIVLLEMHFCHVLVLDDDTSPSVKQAQRRHAKGFSDATLGELEY